MLHSRNDARSKQTCSTTIGLRSKSDLQWVRRSAWTTHPANQVLISNSHTLKATHMLPRVNDVHHACKLIVVGINRPEPGDWLLPAFKLSVEPHSRQLHYESRYKLEQTRKQNILCRYEVVSFTRQDSKGRPLKAG